MYYHPRPKILTGPLTNDAEDEEMDEEEEMMWEAYDAGLCDDDESTKATTKSPLTATPKSAAPAPSS